MLEPLRQSIGSFKGEIDRAVIDYVREGALTAHLENGDTIENAQAIAAHESPRTTKL